MKRILLPLCLFTCLLTCMFTSAVLAQNNIRITSLRFVSLSAQTNQFTNESSVTDGYEIQIGNPYSGDGYPVAIFQNASVAALSDVKVQLRLVNDVSGSVFYSRQLCVDKSQWHDATNAVFTDANGTPTGADPDSIPAGAYLKVRFPKLTLTSSDTNKHGLYRFEASIIPQTCAGGIIADNNTKDNTMKAFVYLVANTTTEQAKLLQAMQQSRLFHYYKRSDGMLIPDVNQWIVKGADIVSGEQACYNVGGQNRNSHAENDAMQIVSPVIRMNRRGLQGEDPTTGGDTLISPAFDIRAKKGLRIVLEVQRAGRIRKDRFWCDSILQGPEHKVYGDSIRKADELLVEFATPDSIASVANTTAWNIHPRPANQPPITDNPAYTLLGGGGAVVGFNGNTALTSEVGLRKNQLDDGKDEEFKTIIVAVPDTLTFLPGAANFRFRLRVNATKHGNATVLPFDDDDNFFIRSCILEQSTPTPDISLTAITSGLAYTIVPRRQASAIPISIELTNKSTTDVSAFVCKLSNPYSKADRDKPASWSFRTLTVPFLQAGRSSLVTFPVWSAKEFSGNKEKDTAMFSAIVGITGDKDKTNDTLSYEVPLQFGDVFAYEGYSTNGKDDYTGIITVANISLPNFAMEFRLTERDTLFGYRALLNTIKNAPSYTYVYDLFNENGQAVAGARITRTRGYDDTKKTYVFDEYATVLLAAPLVLEPGKYTMRISALSQTGCIIGASALRAGVIQTEVSTYSHHISWSQFTDKTLPYKISNGQRIDMFPYSVTLSGESTPIIAQYPNNGEFGTVNGYNTYTNGSWMPCMRPYFPENKNIIEVPKDTAQPTIESEIAYCAGYSFIVSDSIIPTVVQNKASKNVSIELDTTGNSVQVRITLKDSTQNGFAALNIQGRKSEAITWMQTINKLPAKPIISFSNNILSTIAATAYQWFYNSAPIAGATTSGYTPTANGSYTVRITNEDGCQTESDAYIYNLLSIEEQMRDVALGIQPNPAQQTTTIVYHQRSAGRSIVDVLDMSGRVLTTLFDNEQVEGTQQIFWDCHNVPSGVYMIRVTSERNMVYRRIAIVH